MIDQLHSKLHNAGYQLSHYRGEQALKAWQHALAEFASTPKEASHCLLMCSEHLAEIGLLDNSIEQLKQAINLLKLPDDREEWLTLYSTLSYRYTDYGHYHEALDALNEIAVISAEFGELEFYIQAIIGIGNLCGIYGDHRRALRYYKKIDGLEEHLASHVLKLRYKLYKVACFLTLNQSNNALKLLEECKDLSSVIDDKVLIGQIILYHAKALRLQGDVTTALKTITQAQYSINNLHAYWLSNIMKIEISLCLTELGKAEFSEVVINHAIKRARAYGSDILIKQLLETKSSALACYGNFKGALECEKEAQALSTLLIKQVPISELGGYCMRKLGQLELQLRLILSEQENKELKATTATQKDTVAKLQQDVFMDPLTQLQNRRWLDIRLQDNINNRTPFALLVVDVDHFKSINDKFSHLTGDKVLKALGTIMNETFLPHHPPTRFGGEEFVVVLENHRLDQALKVAEQLRSTVETFNWSHILGKREVTISLGLTLYKTDEDTQDTFHRADNALYSAKANGRNQVKHQI